MSGVNCAVLRGEQSQAWRQRRRVCSRYPELKWTVKKAYHRVCLVLACTCLGVAASGDGYLSSGSPTVLRFQPKPRSVGKSTLPPLPEPVADAKVNVPPARINTNGTTTVTAGEAPPPSSEPPVATNGFELTPQMMVDIFQSRGKNGNGHDAHVWVPFGFVPPAGSAQPVGPVPSASSTATYRTE